MTSFRFRLQPVLDHRRRVEEQAQLEHAQAEAARQREEGALAGLRHAEESAFEELERQRFTGVLDVEALQLGMGYLDVLKLQIQRQEGIVTRVCEHVDARREHLVACMQERRVLDRLREKQLAAFSAEQNRLEAAAADEIVVMRYGRGLIESRRATVVRRTPQPAAAAGSAAALRGVSDGREAPRAG